MTLWFDKAYKSQPWFLGSSVMDIDTKIKELKLPNWISRIPRSIKEELGHWKASKFRTSEVRVG